MPGPGQQANATDFVRVTEDGDPPSADAMGSLELAKPDELAGHDVAEFPETDPIPHRLEELQCLAPGCMGFLPSGQTGQSQSLLEEKTASDSGILGDESKGALVESRSLLKGGLRQGLVAGLREILQLSCRADHGTGRGQMMGDFDDRPLLEGLLEGLERISDAQMDGLSSRGRHQID